MSRRGGGGGLPPGSAAAVSPIAPAIPLEDVDKSGQLARGTGFYAAATLPMDLGAAPGRKTSAHGQQVGRTPWCGLRTMR